MVVSVGSRRLVGRFLAGGRRGPHGGCVARSRCWAHGGRVAWLGRRTTYDRWFGRKLACQRPLLLAGWRRQPASAGSNEQVYTDTDKKPRQQYKDAAPTISPVPQRH